MATTRDFNSGRKKPDAKVVVVCLRPQNKRSLRVIELACYSLHLPLSESVRIGYHSGGIAREFAFGKGVDLIVDID